MRATLNLAESLLKAKCPSNMTSWCHLRAMKTGVISSTTKPNKLSTRKRESAKNTRMTGTAHLNLNWPKALKRFSGLVSQDHQSTIALQTRTVLLQVKVPECLCLTELLIDLHRCELKLL